MAYEKHQLSALSYANGFTLWHYRTDDEGDEVLAQGYFDGAVRMLRVGDFLFINATQLSMGGSGGDSLAVVVTKNDARAVEVAALFRQQPSA